MKEYITTNRGTWTVTYDSGAAGTAWGTLSWTADTPANTGVTGRVRAADTVAGLGGQSYVGVGNGVRFTGVAGRYIQIEITLQTSVDGVTPLLYEVTVEPDTPCDPDPALTWNAPLNPAVPHNLSSVDNLNIRFSWGTCAGFVRDESVVIIIRDQAGSEYPVTAFMYGWDIAINDALEEYSQDFNPSWYWVAPGTVLEIEVYLNGTFVGETLVNVIP